MVARIEWLNNSIDRMLAGTSPLTPEQWTTRHSIIERDIEMLRQAARLNALRPGASHPDPAFTSRLRERMLAEAGQ
jgi:hypothetical protein